MSDKLLYTYTVLEPRAINVEHLAFMFVSLTRALVPRRTFPKSLRLISSSSRLYADPWPLPHTPEHMANTVTPDNVSPLPPMPRHNEAIETKRARLVYQSRKRGTLESDLLLSTFARDQLGTMDEQNLHEYDKVLQGAMRFIHKLTINSCLTSLIGTYTTGQLAREHLLNDGQIQRFFRNYKSMHGMKEKLFGSCHHYDFQCGQKYLSGLRPQKSICTSQLR